MVPGLNGKSEMVVGEEDLVSRQGEIPVDVLSTPRLIQLMESAAVDAIREVVPSDQLSLGTHVRVRHLSPTPLGMKVVAHALLKEVDQNRLVFMVDAYDERGKVGEGEHERVLVLRERFFEKVKKKKPA